jgi:hypothetical protein
MPLIISAQPVNIDIVQNSQPINNEKINYENVLKYVTELENKTTVYKNLKFAKVSVNLIDSVFYYRFASPIDSTFQTRTYYKYNSDGNKTYEISYEGKLDATKKWGWAMTYKNEKYVYDSIFNVTSVDQYAWTAPTKRLSIKGSDTTYTIVPGDYYKTTITNIFDSESRVIIKKYRIVMPLNYLYLAFNEDHYKYSTSGDSIIIIFFYVNENNLMLAGQYQKTESTYDSLNNKITDVQYKWSIKSTRWFCYQDYKYNYAYNNYKKIDTMVISYLDTLNNKRIPFFKAEYQYNSNGSQASHIYYNLDYATNQLVQVNKSDYAYDANGMLRQKTSYTWNKVKNQWDMTEKMLNYYSSYIVTERPSAILPTILNKKSLNLYTNPAHDYVTLEVNDNFLKNVGLYNTFGQLLRTYNIQQGVNKLNIVGLPKGMYLIKVPSKPGLGVCKLLVE